MTDTEEKKLFLLDAYALIFRAYYALIRMPRITQAGFNTSAIFGFVNTLEELLRKENPSHIAVCFDPPGPTFRHEATADYKAERSATPEDIKLSVPFIKEIVKAYGIPLVEVAGYEADDVIGTLSVMASGSDFTTYMMSPDKDFGQLVRPNVLQYKPSYRGQDFELRGPEEVCARYGISNPRQVIDLLALWGDVADNIPGCPGVGEVTARKLIAEFGSVENIIAGTDRLKGALKKKIEDNREQIVFSKFLATIRTDVPVGVSPDDLLKRPEDTGKLMAIFKELEFKTLGERVMRRIRGEQRSVLSGRSAGAFQASLFDFEPDAAETPRQEVEREAEQIKADYRMVTDSALLGELRKEVEAQERVGLFLMADGENDMSAEWVGGAVATAKGKAFYVPGSNREATAFLLDLIAMPSVEKVTIAAKRDMVEAAKLRGDGNTALDNFYDIGLAHYVLQPEMRHGLDALAQTYLGYEMMPNPGSAKGSRHGGSTWSSAGATDDALSVRACECADISLRLYSPLGTEVERAGMEKLLREVEFPLVPVLASMELAGVRIDTEALRKASDDMEQRLAALQSEIYELAGMEFNVGSPSAVGEVLFDHLHLSENAGKTKTGKYSTSEDVLEKLLPKHPVVAKILEYRGLKKLLSTYLQALPAAINPTTGKVHTNYNQTVTATGRISSTAPNLQNIPVREEEGRGIRKAFIADPGCLFMSADYSQIELRLMADFSDDPIMVDAFLHGKDIHAITAAKIFHKTPEEVTAGERRSAKTANFGILYGISPFGLSTRLGIPRAEAKEIIDNYFATFPTIRKYQSDMVEHARERGYVETRMGRRRILADINSRNPTVRGYAERNAVNAPLQGTAADIIKVAMIRIWNEMRERGMKSTMIMQIHDELNFNVVPEELAQMQELVERQMQGAYHGRVPLTASCGVADNWLDAH